MSSRSMCWLSMVPDVAGRAQHCWQLSVRMSIGEAVP